MMDAMKGKINLDNLVHRIDFTFTTSITSHALPLKFRMPYIDSYDGSRDPCDHIALFKTLMHL